MGLTAPLLLHVLQALSLGKKLPVHVYVKEKDVTGRPADARIIVTSTPIYVGHFYEHGRAPE